MFSVFCSSLSQWAWASTRSTSKSFIFDRCPKMYLALQWINRNTPGCQAVRVGSATRCRLSMRLQKRTIGFIWILSISKFRLNFRLRFYICWKQASLKRTITALKLCNPLYCLSPEIRGSYPSNTVKLLAKLVKCRMMLPEIRHSFSIVSNTVKNERRFCGSIFEKFIELWFTINELRTIWITHFTCLR